MTRGAGSARPAARYVGVARASTLPHPARLGPAPLTVAWMRPRRGVYAAGTGAAGRRGGAEGPEAAAVRWLDAPPDDLVGPWFGGWGFAPGDAWAGFADEQWVLPELLAWGPPGRVRVAAFAPVGTPRAALEARLDAAVDTPAGPSPGEVRREPGDAEAWALRVRRALDAIATGELRKIVLARALSVRAERAFDPRRVLERLVAAHPDAWTYLATSPDGDAFLGASPETLCDVTDGQLATEALAGTARAGAEGDLDGAKERLEHQLVVDAIVERLGSMCAGVEVAPRPHVEAQGSLRHLCTPVLAALRPGVEALAVARALHPTPAVAGTPTAAATAWIARLEEARRGWYAGAIGACGEDRLTLGVALRGARLAGRGATLFVGAGIVPGSDAGAEWAETELKASVMLRALEERDGE